MLPLSIDRPACCQESILVCLGARQSAHRCGDCSTRVLGRTASDMGKAPVFRYFMSTADLVLRLFKTILARVDGTTYSLFGDPGNIGNGSAATTTFVSFTSSHTLIELAAGAASITLDFFSPVLPGTNDYVRQSLPYSYLTVTAGKSMPANLTCVTQN